MKTVMVSVFTDGFRPFSSLAFVLRLPPCTGGNEARGVFSQKLDSGDGGERPRGAGSGAPLARGEGPRLSTELLDCGASFCVGFPLRRGTNED